jgi:hypothetical protein
MEVPMAHDVLISIQAYGFGHDPARGHLAAAVLGDPDTVLVPSPPPVLLDPETDIEVLMIPFPLDGRLIERLYARCQLTYTAGRDRSVVAILKLSQRSSYAPTIAPFNGPALAEALEAHGDAWRAMEAIGMVEPGIADGPPAGVFEALPAAERDQRRRIIRAHPHRRPFEVGLSICKLLCICQPSPPDAKPTRVELRPVDSQLPDQGPFDRRPFDPDPFGPGPAGPGSVEDR